MQEIELGIIGGSGLYNMAELTEVEEQVVDTPFGAPSDALLIGTLHGRRVAFLPRHGRGHKLNPSQVPYRANIYALKALGVRSIISVSACGSLQELYAPGNIVVPNQLFDYTKGLRARSFFEDGLVVHVSVAEPFDAVLSQAVYAGVQAAGGTAHLGGTFITIEGPRFSTKGESQTYRRWGMDIIGMTACPEAFLAAEAEIAYACMAHVTDYDVWHESEEPVTVEMVIRTLQHNTQIAQQAISHVVAHMPEWAGERPVHHALRDAIITHRPSIPPTARQKLALLVDKYL